MKDLMNTVNVKRVLSPVSVADTTAQVGQIFDRKGFAFDKLIPCTSPFPVRPWPPFLPWQAAARA
jgi:hypothetical protein